MTRLSSTLLLLFLLSSIVAGCSPTFDSDQAHLCRIAARGVTRPGARIEILGESAVADPVGGSAIRIDFRLEGATARKFIECAFGKGVERLTLMRARTETEVLSEPRTFMLNRFWLGTDEAANDPMPVPGAAAAPDLPPRTGYAAQQIINALPGAAAYGLLAAAYSLVYGLVGRINLAFGAFAAIGGAATVLIVIAMQGTWPVALIIPVAIVLTVVCAGCHGIAATRLVFIPVARSTGQQALVATMGLALFLGEYLHVTQGPWVNYFVPMLDTPIAVAREGPFIVTATPMLIVSSVASMAAAVGLLAHLKYAPFGREWRACSDDAYAAALFGVNRDAVLGQTLVIATALAGFSGCITCLSFGSMDSAYATTLAMKALAAAIVGGIGSVSGALLGGIFIGLIESGWSATFPISYRDLVVFVVLVATLIWRPGGFFGDADLAPRRV